MDGNKLASLCSWNFKRIFIAKLQCSKAEAYRIKSVAIKVSADLYPREFRQDIRQKYIDVLNYISK